MELISYFPLSHTNIELNMSEDMYARGVIVSASRGELNEQTTRCPISLDPDGADNSQTSASTQSLIGT